MSDDDTGPLARWWRLQAARREMLEPEPERPLSRVAHAAVGFSSGPLYVEPGVLLRLERCIQRPFRPAGFDVHPETAEGFDLESAQMGHTLFAFFAESAPIALGSFPTKPLAKRPDEYLWIGPKEEGEQEPFTPRWVALDGEDTVPPGVRLIMSVRNTSKRPLRFRVNLVGLTID